MGDEAVLALRETGLLIPPNDFEALAAAIVRLLTDPPFADMIARRGRDLVHERFCIELRRASRAA
ncbi:MAG: hypothetical protein ABSE70_01420 [Candidatus Limnocylindrales bacterium]